MWLEHWYCYFQPVFSAILLKSRKVQVFRSSLLTEYGQDKRLQISNLRRNGFRPLLNFHRRRRLVDENTLIFVAAFGTLTKLSELSSQFSSCQWKLKWLRQQKFSSLSLLTKKHCMVRNLTWDWMVVGYISVIFLLLPENVPLLQISGSISAVWVSGPMCVIIVE